MYEPESRKIKVLWTLAFRGQKGKNSNLSATALILDGGMLRKKNHYLPLTLLC
jgi:hypothetical protein